jgi:hypothetical protein
LFSGKVLSYFSGGLGRVLALDLQIDMLVKMIFDPKFTLKQSVPATSYENPPYTLKNIVQATIKNIGAFPLEIKGAYTGDL